MSWRGGRALAIIPQLCGGSAGPGSPSSSPAAPATRPGRVLRHERPNPVPGVFGYHEVFHALTVAGAALHFAAIAGYALPRSG